VAKQTLFVAKVEFPDDVDGGIVDETLSAIDADPSLRDCLRQMRSRIQELLPQDGTWKVNLFKPLG
jgi:hypothetical protein